VGNLMDAIDDWYNRRKGLLNLRKHLFSAAAHLNDCAASGVISADLPSEDRRELLEQLEHLASKVDELRARLARS